MATEDHVVAPRAVGTSAGAAFIGGLFGLAVAAVLLLFRGAFGAWGPYGWSAGWTFIVAVVSAFTGGLVASRLARAATRGAGALHGCAAWAFPAAAVAIAFMGVFGWGGGYGGGGGGYGGYAGGGNGGQGEGYGGGGAAAGGRVANAGAGNAYARIKAPALLATRSADLLRSFNRLMVAEGITPVTERGLSAALSNLPLATWESPILQDDAIYLALQRGLRLPRIPARRLAAQLEGRWYEIQATEAGLAPIGGWGLAQGARGARAGVGAGAGAGTRVGARAGGGAGAGIGAAAGIGAGAGVGAGGPGLAAEGGGWGGLRGEGYGGGYGTYARGFGAYWGGGIGPSSTWLLGLALLVGLVAGAIGGAIVAPTRGAIPLAARRTVESTA